MIVTVFFKYPSLFSSSEVIENVTRYYEENNVLYFELDNEDNISYRSDSIRSIFVG